MTKKISESSFLSLSLVVTLGGGLIGFTFWLTSLYNSVAQAQKDIIVVQNEQTETSKAIIELNKNVSLINARLDSVANQGNVQEIKKLLNEIKNTQDVRN